MKYLILFLFLIGCHNEQPKIPKSHFKHIKIMPLMSDVEVEEMKNKDKELNEILKVYN
jgi:hypothetical protein